MSFKLESTLFPLLLYTDTSHPYFFNPFIVNAKLCQAIEWITPRICSLFYMYEHEYPSCFSFTFVPWIFVGYLHSPWNTLSSETENIWTSLSACHLQTCELLVPTDPKQDASIEVLEANQCTIEEYIVLKGCGQLMDHTSIQPSADRPVTNWLSNNPDISHPDLFSDGKSQFWQQPNVYL